MVHGEGARLTAQFVGEIRQLPPVEGWARYEPTGRACVTCPCGYNSGFIAREDAIQAYKEHGAGLALARYELLRAPDSDSGSAHA
ncbi:hypothetical protein [Streptomyces ardesiacus]|uniref:Uncharacterized protein n=1 Tax=Streptomyces ardesiacus TaxID=285564 RepID=A0ABW8H776_9ACTN